MLLINVSHTSSPLACLLVISTGYDHHVSCCIPGGPHHGTMAQQILEGEGIDEGAAKETCLDLAGDPQGDFLVWHSHGKWPIEIEVYLLNIVIFHGYVK